MQKANIECHEEIYNDLFRECCAFAVYCNVLLWVFGSTHIMLCATFYILIKGLLAIPSRILQSRTFRIRYFVSCWMNVHMHTACKKVRRPIDPFWSGLIHSSSGVVFSAHPSEPTP